MTMSRYAAVIFDADSTLAGIEGIDWLAGLRGPDVTREVALLTDDAMAGRVPLEDVYARRLEIIAPTIGEVAALSRAYLEALDPTAPEAVACLRAAGVEVRVVSGGLRPALLPMTGALGVPDEAVHAVEIRFDDAGRFSGVVPSPLTTQAGKAEVARALRLPHPVLAVGDGVTDLAMRPEVDAFAAYVGFVLRRAVAEAADYEVRSCADVVERVLRPLS